MCILRNIVAFAVSVSIAFGTFGQNKSPQTLGSVDFTNLVYTAEAIDNILADGVGLGSNEVQELIAQGNFVSSNEVRTIVNGYGFATKEELLMFYYPDGTVTNFNQITTTGIDYEIQENGNAAVKKYSGSESKVIIPWQISINGTTVIVSSISAEAFKNSAVEEVIVPSSVTKVGGRAFHECSSLKRISMQNVTSIAYESFVGCISLTDISIPSVLTVGSSLFTRCINLRTIQMDNLITLSSYAFYGCTNLNEVSLHSVKTIGANAFYNCKNLSLFNFGITPNREIPTLSQTNSLYTVPTTCKFIIPIGMYDEWIAAPNWSDLYAQGYKFDGYASTEDVAAVQNMLGEYAKKIDLEGFATEADLLAFYYPDGNVTSMDQITTNGIEYAVGSDGGAYVVSGNGLSGHVVLPWKVTIGGKEYKVTAIGESAFDADYYSDNNFTSFTAPITVKSIMDYAFYDCNSLTSISFPSVTNIMDFAFVECSSLTSISIPSAISIGNGAFSECSSLTSVSFPSAKIIKLESFYYCNSLTSISIPSAISIGNDAFSGCDSLTLINFGSSPKPSVPSLSGNAFDGAPTSCRFIIPLGMYDEWIAAPNWSDLYAQGYKFDGYASTKDVSTITESMQGKRDLTNNVAVADSVQFTEWKFSDGKSYSMFFEPNVPIADPVTGETVEGDAYYFNLNDYYPGVDPSFQVVALTGDESPLELKFEISGGALSIWPNGLSATRERVVITKSGEPYVTPTGVYAIVDTQVSNLSNEIYKAVAFQSDIPTKVSQLTNDVPYLALTNNNIIIGDDNLVRSSVSGKNIIVGDGNQLSNNSQYRNVVIGNYAEINNSDKSIALGDNIIISNVETFVWNKTTSGGGIGFPSIGVGSYSDHGAGTFNINPINGIGGFYIGDQSLLSHLQIEIPEIARTNGFVTQSHIDSKQYPMFIIDLNPDGSNKWFHVELKATTNNFGTAGIEGMTFFCATTINGAHSLYQGVYPDWCKIFVLDYNADPDVRRWKAISNTADLAIDGKSTGTLVIIVDPELLQRAQGTEWLYEGNDELIWSYVRIGDAEPERTSDGRQRWRAIMPVRWYRQLPVWANQGVTP